MSNRQARAALWAFVAFAAALLAWSAARAAAPPPGDPQNELLQPYAAWVRGLTDAAGNGCCALSDCRVADYHVTASGYEAWLDDRTWPGAPNAWVAVPERVVIRKFNPTGFAVACWSLTHKWYCFTPASAT